MASPESPSASPSEPRTAAAWLEAVMDAERRGELLFAFDLAGRGLAQFPDDLALKHRAVLALARAGATDEARRRYREYGLDEVDDEDVAALGARIEKDVALAAPPGSEERRRYAHRSSELYGAIFERTGGYYPGINAATLSMLAGDGERARELARDVLDRVAGGAEESYYEAATEAEARLLLGDADGAREALAVAAARHGGDRGAVATTRRQLRLVCDAVGVDPEVLAALPAPTVVHYSGHLISESGRFRASSEADVARRIEAEVRAHRPAYAYGSLASGGDILWAEAMLAHGAEIHVVLPFAREEFIRTSVAPAGPGWVGRFERCLAAAAAVSYATEGAHLGDDVLYRYGSELAMGLALLRARYLEADAVQLAVWDGGPPGGPAGTAIDVATWRSLGRPTTIVTPDGGPADPRDASAPGSALQQGARVVRALLFADVHGFSRLSDEQLPAFSRGVLGSIASALDRWGDAVCYRNTWGDGLFAVVRDAASAAGCALDLQTAVRSLDLYAYGLPGHLGLRLSGHLGPVFEVEDPVLRIPSFMGAHVSRAARIEPVTPVGTVYVTEPFAAALVLAAEDEHACDYVGHMPAAKDYGRLRMYRLRRRRET